MTPACTAGVNPLEVSVRKQQMPGICKLGIKDSGRNNSTTSMLSMQACSHWRSWDNSNCCKNWHCVDLKHGTGKRLLVTCNNAVVRTSQVLTIELGDRYGNWWECFHDEWSTRVLTLIQYHMLIASFR